MARITAKDRRLLADLASVAYSNPFSPERIAAEKKVLGKEFVADDGIAWSRSLAAGDVERPNVLKLTDIAVQLVQKFREQANAETESFSPDVLAQYWDVVTYLLLYQHGRRQSRRVCAASDDGANVESVPR